MEKWMIHRIGLINFWYYDEEEFQFENGRLLLRGSNGSGKSVTMQSFIPLLLDGNKSPERLDPFGSRARRLENYLLGEEELGEDERTGYLYMEFIKKGAGVYLTIGMGLRARRGKNLDFWGFSITDGRRIGKDFFLYKNVGEKIPYSKIELRNKIANGGELWETQKDYMAMVNKLLFGFENLDDYDELIKLLIQIRTPKLSKDFKPTVIYDIMNNSLQPLSDDDLRPMSEAIENMDNIKSQLEMLQESQKAIDRLKIEYDRYNRYILFDKARSYTESKELLERQKKDIQQWEIDLEEYRKKYRQSQLNLENYRAEQRALEHKKQELEQHDAFRIKQDLDKNQQLLEELKIHQTEKQQAIDLKKSRERQVDNQKNEAESNQEITEQEIKELLDEMDELAYDLFFHEHSFAAQELLKDLSQEYDFSYLRKEIDRYRERITKARKVLEQEQIQHREHDRLLQELDLTRKEKEDAARQVDRCREVFEQAKDEMIEQVYHWNSRNLELKLSETSMMNISRLIHSYGISATYDDIIAEVRKEYNFVHGNFLKNIAELESIKTELKKKFEQKKTELEEWKNKKDPEPQRDKKVELNRARLKRQGIPFLPLYQAVDFSQELSEDLKGRIEEALIEMGILDALIVPEEYRSQVLKTDKGMADKYLFTDPKYLAYELSSWVKPDKQNETLVSLENIEDALKSILLDPGDTSTYITEKGEYGIGILKGKVSDSYQAKFIGQQARRRYRQEMIDLIEQEIADIKAEINIQEQKISTLKNRINVLEQEYKAIPDRSDLDTGLKMLEGAQITLDNRQREVEQKEVLAEESYKELKQIREQVRELTAKMDIPVTLESYEQAQEDAEQYRDLLGDMEAKHAVYLQLVFRVQSLKQQIEDILNDLDELLYDMNRINRQLDECSRMIQNFQEMLSKTNYEEIKKEINECIEGLNSLPGKIEEEIKNGQRYTSKCEATEEKLNKLKEETVYYEKVCKLLSEGFKQEYDLGYVTKQDSGELYQTAKSIYNRLKAERKEVKTKEDYISALQEKYHQNRQYLIDYNLSIRYLFDEELWEEDERIQTVIAGRRRLDLTARIQGRDVDFYALVQFIQEAIEENEKLLKESDRQLFEDILANTISKKIRARIYHAEQWVKKMNSLMEAMNTSSGLSFSLAWKSKVAEMEEQLDTKELVEILKSDVNLLREEDFARMSAHFRSKITQARKRLEDNASTQTFHVIMKDILDYRQWFEFRLFYKKTNENKKELTNNAFDKFSGGEKAMAMYVPLFSAVYARYENARKDCPRIISLDEAFAGVDENNIRDMFKLLEELKLSFIMNSQILWGDYDTVPALSICELIRPDNANVVSVIRYLWNGKVRKLVV